VTPATFPAHTIILPLATYIYSTTYEQLFLQTKWNARIYWFFITWPLTQLQEEFQFP